MSQKMSWAKSYFAGTWLVCLIWIAASSACAERVVDELTSTSPYAGIVGTEYRIIAEVAAYGIYESLDKKTVSYITLIPGVGISGPEVAFKKRIGNGQNIRILSAWREHKSLYSDVYYLVALRDADLPPDIKVRIDLSRGNEGLDAGLNPSVYQKLAR